MKSLITLVAVLTLSTSAFAQRSWQQRQTAEAMDSGTMIEHNGIIFAVVKTHLVKINFETFEVIKRTDLVRAGRTQEEEDKLRREWIKKNDTNEDGTVDDLDNGWRWWRYLDENKDGKVTADEAYLDNPPIATDKATLKIWKNKLVMMRSGHIFRFNIDTLELEKSVKIAPPKPEKPKEEEKKTKENKDAKKKNEEEDVF